jgi:acetyl esterase/lipase
MNTLHLVDAEYRDFAPHIPIFDPERTTLAQMRADMVAAFAAMIPAAALEREERLIAGPAGAPDVRVLIYRPDRVAGRQPAILYIHGGGFVAGNPDMCDAATAKLAKDNGVIIVAVDYRLAPETPFPGPLEDCYAALAWMVEHAEALGIDPARVAVLGDSAGGGLAAALALLARDRRRYTLTAQLLVYPMLDHRTGTSAALVDNPSTGEFVWNRATNRFGWTALRGNRDMNDSEQNYFSPALASELSGLPRTLVAVGSLDLFLDEDVVYALRLSRAGVAVELHVYEGGFHGFDRLPGALSARFAMDLGRAIQRVFER